MTIRFIVTGDPKAQPRPRAFARKMGDKFTARIYDAGTAEGWKSQIAMKATPHRPAAPFDGPLSVNATFIFKRPNAHFVGNKPAKPLRADAPEWHTTKPDRDNLEKALLDTITQLGGFWHDDTQVCAGEIRKVYGATPGAVVEISTIDAPVAQEKEAA